MADGIDEAAAAFTEVIKSETSRPSPARSNGKTKDTGTGPQESLFSSVGELEVDEESPSKGGGDDDEETVLYGKDQGSEDDSRGPRKGEKEDSEGDDDESDGDDADDDGDADEDEGTGIPEDQLQTKVEVTVDGEPVEVTLKEALEGYVRTETWHRRMNQLDEAKKIVRRAATDAVHNFEYSVNLAKEMEEYMNTMIPQEPDWDKEFAADPAKARDLQRYHEKAKAFRAELRAKQAEIVKKQQDSNAAQLATFVEEESAKFDNMNRKHWSDPKKKAKDLQSMRRTGLASGFTEEELSQVYDSRMLQVLLKASKYDRMMAAKPKPFVRPQGKPIPPGAGSAKQRTAQKGVTSAMKRLNRTGSIDDAAVVFDQLIQRG
jgi:transcription termination factor NusB